MSRPMEKQPSTTVLRAAVIQAAPLVFDLDASLERLRGYVAEAAGEGAQLVVAPESFLSGYPKGADFAARVGTRAPEGRELWRQYWESSVDLDGETGARIGRIARDHATQLVVGVMERYGRSLYCTQAHFAPDGRLIGRHRKLVPTGVERLIWASGDGSTLPVVDGPSGARVGGAICWEHYMPLLRAAMYAKGTSVWASSTVDDRPSWIPTMQHVAVEGRCFVLNACQYMTRADIPPGTYVPDLFEDKPETVLIRGGSCIVNPFGELVAGPVYDESAVLVADVDLADTVRGQYDLDVSGHYARGDVFALQVNESPLDMRFAGGIARLGVDGAD